MNDDFRIFLATIWGEAAGCSIAARRAIASVIMNRVHFREWRHLDSPLAVITAGGFDAYKQKNHPYREAYAAFSPATKGPIPGPLRAFEDSVRAIYERLELPTTAAVLYYSPKAQAALHARDPKEYRPVPAWDFKLLQEVHPEGLLPTDDFRFYKYGSARA